MKTIEERIEEAAENYIINNNEGGATMPYLYNGFKSGINSPLAQELQEEDAIAFKDWCDDYAWEEDFFHQHKHTTKELYAIYKLSKK